MSKRTMLGLTLALGLGGLGGLGAISGAQAAPLAATTGAALAGEAAVETVAMGCGPGWTRGPWGRCRPMGYGPPRFYGRRCFFRPTPWGPRRVCRW